MKKTSKLECGGKRLDTDNLEAASEWLLDNIAGLRTFELQIEIHGDDLGCSLLACKAVEAIGSMMLEMQQESIEFKKTIEGMASQMLKLSSDNDKLRGIFGDYDFHPTVEQCRGIWNNTRLLAIRAEELNDD